MTFKKDRYKILRNAISKELCDFLKNYFLEKEQIARLYFSTETKW